MFLTYHTVPKTYLAVQDRELVSDPTNRSARNGQNTKSTNGASTLTSARGWHGAFTPAHEVSQNRPKQSGLSIDIFIYNRVEALKILTPAAAEQHTLRIVKALREVLDNPTEVGAGLRPVYTIAMK